MNRKLKIMNELKYRNLSIELYNRFLAGNIIHKAKISFWTILRRFIIIFEYDANIWIWCDGMKNIKKKLSNKSNSNIVGIFMEIFRYLAVWYKRPYKINVQKLCVCHLSLALQLVNNSYSRWNYHVFSWRWCTLHTSICW